jgi:hydrogenase expression/formation protein HypC
MCWAVPAKVVAIDTDVIAEVDLGGGTIKKVAIGVDNVKPGDYVMVHAGVIIEKLSKEGVIENLKFIAEEIQRTEEIMGVGLSLRFHEFVFNLSSSFPLSGSPYRLRVR